MSMPVELAARELALAQARTLARAGRYAEAEDLLSGGEQPGAAVLDLLARIHAQQGHLDRADRYWAEAQRLAPGDEEIARARRRVVRVRAGVHRSPWRRPVGVALGIVVLAAAVSATHAVDARSPDAGHPRPHVVARSSSPPALLDVVDLRVPGVRVRRLPTEVSVTFDQGLFRQGLALRRGATTVLDALAARLRPYAPRIVVAVIGYTDDLPAPATGDYSGNVELATLRAAVVREIIRAAGGIPTTSISISGMGDVMAPFPGDDPRDRTVTLRISPAGAG
jgi:flagellar motor protein MotB